MTRLDLLQLAKEMLLNATMVSTPILTAVASLGLAVSLVQALTQVQEQSLSFVPKMLGGITVLLLLGPWILDVLVGFAVSTLTSLGTINQ